MTWSVRLSLDGTPYESGADSTGLDSREVYERLCDRVRERGYGTVSLLKDGEVVVAFTVEDKG